MAVRDDTDPRKAIGEVTSPDYELRRGVWSRYWSSGVLHSCATSYANNYEGPVADFWHRSFDALPAGTRMLDIATGNGPIPRLMFARTGGGIEIHCDAIDLSDIAPTWPAQLPREQRNRLHFRGGVSAESLPFASNAFDLVTSQYGLEYSNMDQAVPELVRVLRPLGGLRCVLHHAQALTVRLAAEELSHIDWILMRGGLLDLGSAMVEPLERARTPQGRASLRSDALMDELRESFNAVQDEAHERIEASACPDVIHESRAAVAAALREATEGRSAVALERLHAYSSVLGDAALRLRELRDCALGDDDAAALCAQLERLGTPAHVQVLSDERGVYGWALRGIKKGA
jgi:SAM-dependent methyltransferase